MKHAGTVKHRLTTYVDSASQAPCIGSVPYCGEQCPRHWPETYARDHAKHAA